MLHLNTMVSKIRKKKTPKRYNDCILQSFFSIRALASSQNFRPDWYIREQSSVVSQICPVKSVNDFECIKMIHCCGLFVGK